MTIELEIRSAGTQYGYRVVPSLNVLDEVHSTAEARTPPDPPDAPPRPEKDPEDPSDSRGPEKRRAPGAQPDPPPMRDPLPPQSGIIQLV
jgi:hypothetical protein